MDIDGLSSGDAGFGGPHPAMDIDMLLCGDMDFDMNHLVDFFGDGDDPNSDESQRSQDSVLHFSGSAPAWPGAEPGSPPAANKFGHASPSPVAKSSRFAVSARGKLMNRLFLDEHEEEDEEQEEQEEGGSSNNPKSVLRSRRPSGPGSTPALGSPLREMLSSGASPSSAIRASPFLSSAVSPAQCRPSPLSAGSPLPPCVSPAPSSLSSSRFPGRSSLCVMDEDDQGILDLDRDVINETPPDMNSGSYPHPHHHHHQHQYQHQQDHQQERDSVLQYVHQREQQHNHHVQDHQQFFHQHFSQQQQQQQQTVKKRAQSQYDVTLFEKKAGLFQAQLSRGQNTNSVSMSCGHKNCITINIGL